MSQTLNKFGRRSLIFAGIAAATTQFPRLILKPFASKFLGNSPIVAHVFISLPAAISATQFEDQVPLWANNEAIQTYIGSKLNEGSLTHFSKKIVGSVVEYRFEFSSKNFLTAFIDDVRRLGLVDFEKRTSLGMKTSIQVNGIDYPC